MKLVLLKTNGSIELIDYPGHKGASWYAKKIGCEWIEIVNPRGFNFTMIVDEEGLLKENDFNYIASYIYGTQIHNQPIVGNVLIADITEDGEISGLEDDYAEALSNSLGQSLERIKNVFGDVL